jgi:hypothetical protein
VFSLLQAERCAPRIIRLNFRRIVHLFSVCACSLQLSLDWFHRFSELFYGMETWSRFPNRAQGPRQPARNFLRRQDFMINTSRMTHSQQLNFIPIVHGKCTKIPLLRTPRPDVALITRVVHSAHRPSHKEGQKLFLPSPKNTNCKHAPLRESFFESAMPPSQK